MQVRLFHQSNQPAAAYSTSTLVRYGLERKTVVPMHPVLNSPITVLTSPLS